MCGKSDVADAHPTAPNCECIVHGGRAALGDAKDADAVTFETRIFSELSKRRYGVVLHIPDIDRALVVDGISKPAGGEAVDDECGDAGPGQLLCVVDFTYLLDSAAGRHDDHRRKRELCVLGNVERRRDVDRFVVGRSRDDVGAEGHALRGVRLQDRNVPICGKCQRQQKHPCEHSAAAASQ